jgi:hypothetical protein
MTFSPLVPTEHPAADGHFEMAVPIAGPPSFLSDLLHGSVAARGLLHSPVPVLVPLAK